MRTRHVISSLQASFRPQRRREKYQSGQIRTEVSPKWQVAHTDMQPSPGERVWKSWWWIFSSFCLREIPHDKREGQCLSRKLVVTAFNKQRLADISNISNIETFLLVFCRMRWTTNIWWSQHRIQNKMIIAPELLLIRLRIQSWGKSEKFKMVSQKLLWS